MTKLFLLVSSLILSYPVTCQITKGELANMSAGVYEGYEYASVKVIEETVPGTQLFIFDARQFPEPEFKKSQIQRFQTILGFVSIKDELNRVELIIDSSIEIENLKRLLLNVSRLYGYVGFKVSLAD